MPSAQGEQPWSQAQKSRSDPLLANPCDDGLHVTDDGGLGEPAVTKTRDRGEEDLAIETLEGLAAVPQLHDLPTVLDGARGKRAPALRR